MNIQARLQLSQAISGGIDPSLSGLRACSKITWTFDSLALVALRAKHLIPIQGPNVQLISSRELSLTRLANNSAEYRRYSISYLIPVEKTPCDRVGNRHQHCALYANAPNTDHTRHRQGRIVRRSILLLVF